jgi:hypothetical protein
MGRPDAHDKRRFEHLAKVDADGVVVAMVELAAGSSWEHWTDGEGSRYVYLTDLIPDRRNASVDVHGLQLLPPVVPATPPKVVTMKKKKARR